MLRRASQGEEDIETAHVYTAPKKQAGRKNTVFYRDESDDEETSAQEETVDGVPVDNSWLVVQKNILLGKDDVYEGTFPSFRKRLWLDEVEGLPESDMAESSSSEEDENSETEVATVEQSNNRKKRNTPLDTEEEPGHFSDSHSSLEPTSRYSRPPNRKMPRLIRSGVSETAISSYLKFVDLGIRYGAEQKRGKDGLEDCLDDDKTRLSIMQNATRTTRNNILGNENIEHTNDEQNLE